MDNLEILKMLFIQNFNMEMVASDLIDMIAPKKLEKYIYQKFKDEFDIEELEKLDTSEVLDYIQEIWEIEIVESDDLAENILFEISNVIDEYSREYYKTENEQEKNVLEIL